MITLTVPTVILVLPLIVLVCVAHFWACTWLFHHWVEPRARRWIEHRIAQRYRSGPP